MKKNIFSFMAISMLCMFNANLEKQDPMAKDAYRARQTRC